MKKFLLLAGILAGSFAGMAAAPEPADGWVEISDAEALATALENKETLIRFVADLETDYEEILKISEDCRIDLNGHKIVFGRQGLAAIGTANVVVCDNAPDGDGEMIVTDRHPLFFIKSAGSFIIESGTYTTTGMGSVLEVGKYIDNVYIEGGRLNGSARGLAVLNTGYVYMTGGTIVGGDKGFEPVSNEVEGVFTLTGGAIYAGNNTSARCFNNVIWVSPEDPDDMEVATTVLPEGVVDGGAIVLDEKWAIPDTYWINYNLPEGTQIQPNQTHYYPKGTDVALPECNYRDYTPFAGWVDMDDPEADPFMAICEASQGNYQLVRVWKYVNLPDEVHPDMIPVSVSPEAGTTLNELHAFVLSFGEGDYYENTDSEDYGGLYNLLTEKRVSDIATIEASWTGDITVTLAEPVTANGSYELRINVASFGNDDWYYDDMEDGRCNPNLFYRYTIYNAPSGHTNCITDPVDGATVETLSEILFTFPDEEMALYNYGVEGIIKKENGDEVMRVDANCVSYTDTDNVLLLTLPESISAWGTYTLSIPAGFFSFDWWERDASALTFTWTVSGSNGVESISAPTSIDGVYDLSGRRVPNQGDLRGIFIVDGKRVLLRKP